MKDAPYIEFSGIKGIQGTHLQFATVWSLSMVLRLLGQLSTNAMNHSESGFDQRFVDQLIADLSNPDFCLTYSPIVVGVNCPIDFIESESIPNYGKIRVPITSTFHIMDGLHRISALNQANLPRSRLDMYEIPVLLYSNVDEKKIQQSDNYFQNYHHEKLVSKKSKILVKKTFQEMTKDALKHSRFLSRAVAVEVSSLSPRSRKLLTLSGLAKGSTPIYNVLSNYQNDNATLLVAAYWDLLSQILKPWNEYLNKRASASEVRNSTILSSVAVVSALGNLGAYIFEITPDSWQQAVGNLATLDWSKSPSSVWEGRAIKNGVLISGKKAELLTCNLMKLACGLPLKQDEETYEIELTKSGRK